MLNYSPLLSTKIFKISSGSVDLSQVAVDHVGGRVRERGQGVGIGVNGGRGRDRDWLHCVLRGVNYLSECISMAVSNDDAMMNSMTRAERIVGDECRICLKLCTETCQLFRNGISEKLMAIAAVQVSSCLLYFKSPPKYSVFRNTYLDRDLERDRSMLLVLFQLFRYIVWNADKYFSLSMLILLPRIIFYSFLYIYK